jgi:hypothetical protein
MPIAPHGIDDIRLDRLDSGPGIAFGTLVTSPAGPGVAMMKIKRGMVSKASTGRPIGPTQLRIAPDKIGPVPRPSWPNRKKKAVAVAACRVAVKAAYLAPIGWNAAEPNEANTKGTRNKTKPPD